MNIFEKAKIKNIELKNRFVRSATNSLNFLKISINVVF